MTFITQEDAEYGGFRIKKQLKSTGIWFLTLSACGIVLIASSVWFYIGVTKKADLITSSTRAHIFDS